MAEEIEIKTTSGDNEPTESRSPDGDPRGSEPPEAGQGQGFVVRDRRFWALSEEDLEKEDMRPKVPSYVETLESKLQERDAQLREYIAAYKKEVGENLQKMRERLEREAMTQIDRARGAVVEPMLDVLDALERSVQMGQGSPNAEAILEGVKMVQMLMAQKLGQLGLSRIATVGEPFDPNHHEALAVAPVSEPSQHNIVQNEIKPGFTLGDRVLRPTQVQVGRLSS